MGAGCFFGYPTEGVFFLGGETSLCLVVLYPPLQWCVFNGNEKSANTDISLFCLLPTGLTLYCFVFFSRGTTLSGFTTAVFHVHVNTKAVFAFPDTETSGPFYYSY